MSYSYWKVLQNVFEITYSAKEKLGIDTFGFRNHHTS